MIADWKKEIAIAWYVQNETAKLDTKCLWEYCLPRVAATESALAATETLLGSSLDPRYREFLGFANGWRNFFQRVDLFGTVELQDAHLLRRVRLLLQEVRFDSPIPNNIRVEEMLPIGYSPRQSDIFVIANPITAGGTVIWVAGYEIQRFSTFDEFFLAMVDYNRLRLRRFQFGATDSPT